MIIYDILICNMSISLSTRAPLGGGGTGDSQYGCAASVWCYDVNADQNPVSITLLILSLTQHCKVTKWLVNVYQKHLIYYTIKSTEIVIEDVDSTYMAGCMTPLPFFPFNLKE